MTAKRFTLAYEKGNWWAVKDGDITLWKEEVIGLLNELYEENTNIKTIILQKLKELEHDYQQSAKAGMPTGIIIGEIYTFEEICKEMNWLHD